MTGSRREATERTPTDTLGRMSYRTLAAVVILASAVQAQDVGPFLGGWEGDGVTLELSAAPPAVAGTLLVGGQTYPLTATPQGTGLVGGFEVAGTRYPVTITLQAGELLLTSDGNARRLRRIGGAPQAQGPWTWETLPAPAGAFASRARPAGAPAQTLLAQALDELARAFGARPRVVGAFVDAQGAEGQALFEGTQAGQPVRGLIVIQGGAGAAVLVGWAPAASFAQALPGLSRTLLPRPAAPVELQVQRFPDGSGQIALPAGWNASFARKGAIDANGPQGWLSFGAARTVFTPEGAAGWYARPPLVAPYTNPLQAMQDMIPQDNAYARQSGGWVTEEWKAIEQSPTEYPGGQAAFIHGEGTIAHPDGRRMRVRNLTLVVIAPIDASQWMYYISQIGSTAEQWPASLPVLMQIWATWKVSDQELRGRLDKARETLREIGELMRGTADERAKSFADTNAAWSHALRGDWPVEDRETGRRADVDLQRLQPSIDALNRAAGYERYREVPLRELNQ